MPCVSELINFGYQDRFLAVFSRFLILDRSEMQTNPLIGISCADKRPFALIAHYVSTFDYLLMSLRLSVLLLNRLPESLLYETIAFLTSSKFLPPSAMLLSQHQ